MCFSSIWMTKCKLEFIKLKKMYLHNSTNFNHLRVFSDYPPPTNKKRGIIYISPQNQRFPTFHPACRFCMENNISKLAISDTKPSNEENVDKLWSGELVCKSSHLQAMDGGAASISTWNQKRKRLGDSKPNIP